MRGGGNCHVKLQIQRHQTGYIMLGQQGGGLLQNVAHGLDIRVGRALHGELYAQLFVADAHFDHVEYVVKRQGRHHHALARHDRDHAFNFQAVQCLMDRRAANTQCGGQLRFVDGIAGAVFAADDALLDLRIGQLAQLGCAFCRCVRTFAKAGKISRVGHVYS